MKIKNVVNLAQSAGNAVMTVYNSGDFATITKDDNSPLTRADTVSNEIICEGLQKISVYPILSEESIINYEVRKNWKKFWLVDPLDGTKDFIAKNGMFTVNIALIEGGIPILGVIHIPAAGVSYYAEYGKGAFRDGVRIYNKSTRTGTSIIAADSVFHSSEATNAFFKKHGIIHIKRYGSSLKYCKLAEGEIDIYPRFNGTKEWDTAAGQAILKESGCTMIDIKTTVPPLYNKPEIQNNYFIAMRNDLQGVYCENSLYN